MNHEPPLEEDAFFLPFGVKECVPLDVRFSGPWDTPIQVTIHYVKYGNLVAVCVPEILGEATNAVTEIRSLSVLDEEFRPDIVCRKLILAVDNGVSVFAILRVTTDGYIIIRRAPDETTAFTGSGLTGVEEGFQMIYGVPDM